LATNLALPVFGTGRHNSKENSKQMLSWARRPLRLRNPA